MAQRLLRLLLLWRWRLRRRLLRLRLRLCLSLRTSLHIRPHVRPRVCLQRHRHRRQFIYRSFAKAGPASFTRLGDSGVQRRLSRQIASKLVRHGQASIARTARYCCCGCCCCCCCCARSLQPRVLRQQLGSLLRLGKERPAIVSAGLLCPSFLARLLAPPLLRFARVIS